MAAITDNAARIIRRGRRTAKTPGLGRCARRDRLARQDKPRHCNSSASQPRGPDLLHNAQITGLFWTVIDAMRRRSMTAHRPVKRVHAPAVANDPIRCTELTP